MVRVHDGDTIQVEPLGKVRLIGVDAPELALDGRAAEPFAREARAYTAAHLLDRHVRLEFDRDRRDRYGRLLAYVYLPDGTLFNERIVADGYALALTRYPFRHAEDFIRREREARDRGLGLWKIRPDESAGSGPGDSAGSGPGESAGSPGVSVADADAGRHVGETATVEGLVAEVSTSGRGTTFVNFGAPYPGQTFSAVLLRENARAFGDLHPLKGRRVRVSGRIRIYHGRPEILLERPAQLVVPDER